MASSPAKESATSGAFDKDKLYGQRLDQAFAANEPFVLFGGRFIDGEVIETDIGDAQPVHLLVQKIGTDGKPVGMPFEVNSIAKPIVEKMQAVKPEELPATVKWFKTYSKKWKTDCTVLQYVGDPQDVNDLAEKYGIDPATIPGAIPF